MVLDKHPEAEALIFDLDGTLTDSMPLHIETWHTVCARFGCTFDEGMIPVLTGAPTVRFAERIIADNKKEGLVDPEELARLKQQAFWQIVHKLKANEPVLALVHKYHGQIPLTIGTGASRKSAEAQLTALNLMDYFDAIITADDVTDHKPGSETFLRCAEIVGVDPVKCQVLEDGELGMQAARNAGMMLTDVRPFLEN